MYEKQLAKFSGFELTNENYIAVLQCKGERGIGRRGREFFWIFAMRNSVFAIRFLQHIKFVLG